MPSKNERLRVEVAFDGGQIVSAVVSAAGADGLHRALASGSESVFELEADDGSYLIPVKRVVYVKRFSRETQIGFGGDS